MRSVLIPLAIVIASNAVTVRNADAQAYMDSGVYQLKTYVQTSHCDQNGRNCDLKPAFDAAMRACNVLRQQDGDPIRGCLFIVPEGNHRLSAEVNLCRRHIIRGAGFLTTNVPLTKLLTDDTAFSMRTASYCNSLCEPTSGGGGTVPADGNGACQPGYIHLGQGGGSTIDGMQLEQSHKAAQAGPYFGVKMESTGTVQNVGISYYTQGIRIIGDNGNVNRFGIFNVDIWHSRHAGVFVRGQDSNAGLGYRVDTSFSCAQGDYWKAQTIDGVDPQGTCAGIMDKSFLGNTWVATHTQDSYDDPNDGGTLGTVFSGLFFEGLQQESVCLGCYDEDGQAANVMAHLTQGISGHGAWQINSGGAAHGLRLRGFEASALSVANKIDPNNWTRVNILVDEPGTAIRVKSYSGPGETENGSFTLLYKPANKAFQLHLDMLGDDGTMAFVVGNSSPLGQPGQVYFTKPFIANPCVFEEACSGH